MLHTKTFMIALITAGCLAAPTASAGYPPPPKYPHPDKHSCEDIELEELKVKVKNDGKVRAMGEIEGLDEEAGRPAGLPVSVKVGDADTAGIEVLSLH